jgi:broad specificity phosphatase PhoE
MSRVYLIRHAKPSATWGGDDDDPGLDDTGKAQAEAAAQALLALPPELRPPAPDRARPHSRGRLQYQTSAR